MNDKKLILSYDDNTGITKFFHRNPINGEISIETVQDTSEVTRFAQAEMEQDDGKYNGEFHKVMDIPKIIINQWWKECGGDPFAEHNKDFLLNKINSSEYRDLRTKKGKV